MKNNRQAIRKAGLALALACSVAVANASLTYKIGNGGLETFNLKIDSTTYNNALVGGISLTYVSGTDSQMPASYNTVCADIKGVVYLGQNYTYELQPFAGHSGLAPSWGATGGAADAAIQNAAHLFYNYYDALTSGGLGGAYSSYGTTTQRAALQLAVWSALYNSTAGTINLSVTDSAARFHVSGGISDPSAITLANSWLTGLTGNYGLAGELFFPVPNTQHGQIAQELLFASPQSIPAVPEASTIIAGLLMVLPLGASTLRILRKRTSA